MFVDLKLSVNFTPQPTVQDVDWRDEQNEGLKRSNLGPIVKEC
jgi:hypothetical protein